MNSHAPVKTANRRARALDQGRESFRKQAWADAFSQLSSADRDAPLEPETLVELAQAALLIAKDAEGADFLARAHQGFLSLKDAQRAARCAFLLGFTSLINGEFAKAGGWLARASRLLDGQPDCVEKGLSVFPGSPGCGMDSPYWQTPAR